MHDLLTLIKVDTMGMLLERSTCHRYGYHELQGVGSSLSEWDIA